MAYQGEQDEDLAFDYENLDKSKNMHSTELSATNQDYLHSANVHSPLHPSIMPSISVSKPREEVLIQVTRKDMKNMIIDAIKCEYKANCDSSKVEMIFGSVCVDIVDI
jgi:hypothetical protein